jgi:hypothetical protein
MTTSTLRTSYDGLRDAVAFADRHSTISGSFRRRIAKALDGNRPARLQVPVFDYEDLTDIIVGARRDGIPVVLDFEGSYLWVDLDFDGLALRALDYHTTCGERYALESLTECPLADLDRLLAAIVESQKAGS